MLPASNQARRFSQNAPAQNAIIMSPAVAGSGVELEDEVMLTSSRRARLELLPCYW